MARNLFSEMLKRYLDMNHYMQQRYRKAAKRQRIRKKWVKRFGPGFRVYLEESLGKPSWLDSIPKGDQWKGGTIRIPFT